MNGCFGSRNLDGLRLCEMRAAVDPFKLEGLGFRKHWTIVRAAR